MPESKARAILEVQVTGINQGNNAVKGFQDNVTRSMTASEKSVASAIGGMIAQYASLAVAVQKAAKVMSSGIEFNKFVENQTMSFGVMMKSMSAAKEQMKDLYNFAVNSPLTFKETAGSAKQLMAYGFAAKELVPTMETLGSVAIATGNRLDDIAYVYGTLRSQGRAYSRDLMQFGMRGIPIYEELAKVMGVGSDQIQKMASQGKIGFKEVEKAFKNMTSAGGRFGGILDAYMDTLTGKMSMLGDIAEQTAGKLMEPTTNVLKDTVEDITKQFQSSGFQSYVKDLSGDIGMIAQALANVLKVIITLLPAITTFVKLWLTFVGLKLAKNVLMNIPGLLFNIAEGLLKGTTALATFTTGGVAFGSAMSMAFATATAGLRAFTTQLMVLIAANPWIIPIVAGAVIAGVGGSLMAAAHERAKTSANPNIRAGELQKEYATKAYSATSGGSTAIMVAEDVKKIAEEYQLAEGTAARILINAGALEESSWKQYINTKSSVQALEEYKKVQEGLKHVSLTMEQEQMNFLAGLTGLPASIYEDLSNVDLNALGGNGAKDYIAGFASARKGEQDIFGKAYTKDMLKESLSGEYEALQEALRAGASIPGLFNTSYDEKIRDRLVKIAAELDGMGGKANKIKEINLGTWWMPLEYAVKRTASQMDDVDLSTRKTMENAQAEFNKRKESYQNNLLLAESDKERYDIQNKIIEEYKQLLKLEKDITAEGNKQKGIARFSELTGQSSTLFDNFQAMAGNAFQAAIDSTNPTMFAKNMAKGLAGTAGSAMQGTEVGDVASGFMQGGVVGLIASIAAKFISLLSSIENVGKSFNALTTIWDSMKKVVNLEGLFNNAFKPIVQHLTQLGAAVGKLMPVIIGILKVANAFMYIINAVVLVALQALGNAFMWLYDYVIVPFGNAVIGFINAIIGVINFALGWAGVNIEYLDALETSTEAMKDFASLIDNMKSSLDQTIDYLTKKINDAVDKQLSSLQDLYEVGAITASDYERQATGLDAQKIKSDYVLVTDADKGITDTAAIYNRLLELYDLKDVLEKNPNLTEQQQYDLLMKAGLSADSLTTAMYNAVYDAMAAYGASKIASDIDISKLDYESASKYAASTPPAITNPVEDAVGNVASAVGGSVVGGTIGMLLGDPVLALAGSLLGGLGSAFGWWDVGASNLPEDQFGMVHKGEGIIPATFMDGIRSGELSLSGGSRSSDNGAVNVNVYVSGSVTSEDNLADTIAQNMYIRRKRGLLTV